MRDISMEEVMDGLASLREGDAARFAVLEESVLAYQAAHNPIYGRYCKTHKYLPIEAFRAAPVTTFPPEEAERVFESSGTTAGRPARHYVRSLDWYRRMAALHFARVFGEGPFTVVGHLPRYEEQGGRSSLLTMVGHFVERFGDAASGFFLEDADELGRAAAHSRRARTPLLLFGAAFGLLDLVERRAFDLPDTALVVETGGMKTHRRAITREALHERLAEGFGLPRGRVWSEYGMCELMSQCYTRGGAVYFPPPWMRVEIVDPEDPSRVQAEGSPGLIAVVDLANVHTVSAVLTEDLGVRRGDGFEVLGRRPASVLRGCNLLLEEALG